MEYPKCSLPLCCETDISIMCKGSCFRSYHPKCLGLSEAVVQCLSKNVIWLCDDCLAAFHERNSQMICAENKTTKIELEIADVKDKIANMMETLSAITPQLAISQQRETFCPTQSPYTARHSTPVSSPPLCIGSKLANGSLAEHSSDAEQSVNENCFSLFLTNIDGSATDQEVSHMVVESLGANEGQKIGVVKLLPKWKMDQYQPYVSFKVTMDKRLKHMALQSGTWPAGVMFREFIEQPRRTWVPNRQERKQR